MKKLAIALAYAFILPATGAAAPIIYQNGTFVGTSGAWLIQVTNNTNYSVSNSFEVSAPDRATSVTFASRVNTGENLTQVDWILSDGSLGAGAIAAGTASVTNVFQFNFSGQDRLLSTFDLPNVNLATPGTYFLTLRNAIVSGGTVGWDEAGGSPTSTAEQSINGSVASRPSEFFFIAGTTSVPELDSARALLPVVFCFLTLLAAQRSRRQATC